MVNIELLKEQNKWWIAKEKIDEDVNIEKLNKVKYVWHPEVIDSFDTEKDIIYTLRGSRQVGKTTALKLLIKRLLTKNQKENICYLTCNNIDTHRELIEVLQIYLEWVNNAGRRYIFIDEITFVKNWTRAIKHLADIGLLQKCTIILTGSNSHDLKYEVERMPGRRGEDPVLDKILFPVTFREYMGFVEPDMVSRFTPLEKAADFSRRLLPQTVRERSSLTGFTADSAKNNYVFYKKELRKYLDNFLLTGGFIQAINSFVSDGRISIDVYHQYLSWVLGDLAKLGRKETFSRQIFEQVIGSMTANIGFDTIAKKTSIGSHLTVRDYLDVMESNFILKILYQIDINKKTGMLRKTKKIYFQDVFLFWVFFGYVFGLSDYFESSKSKLNDAILKSKLIEDLIMSHLMRMEDSVNWSNKVFFFRAANQNEVDFVVRLSNDELVPIEVKYKDGVSFKDFRNLEKINKSKGIVISKEDFLADGDKFIFPAEVFLLVFDKPF